MQKVSYQTNLHGILVVLGGDHANEKLRYPCSELSGDTAKRYRSLGKNVDVNAIRKACRRKQRFQFMVQSVVYVCFWPVIILIKV